MFDSLPGVEAGELRGLWRGEEVPTGHPLDGLLAALGWAGKRFGADGAVDPLVFGRGGRLLAIHPWLPAKLLPLVLRWPRWAKSRAVIAVARAVLPLLRTRRPRARLEQVVREGVGTVAIVYDDAPIVDVLRRVEAGVVMGMMEMGRMAPYFFVLRADADA